MKIKKILLAICLISYLNANDGAKGEFVFNKESKKETQSPTIQENNVIYVKNITGVGESLEKAKNDAIQNAMKFGVGEYLVTKEELNNDELNLEVTNYSNAYVLDYKQIQETNENGIYKVLADVTLEKNKILGTLSKLNINHMDLSSGVLKNYAADTAEKKENAEKLIKNEIIEPFKNGYAYDIEIMDLQPLNRSDLVKARRERGDKFIDETGYKEAANIIDELYVAKVKIQVNENYIKKVEKIISLFSKKLDNSKNYEDKANFIVDDRAYFITDAYIREELFNKNLKYIYIYDIVFRLIDNDDNIFIKKCTPYREYGGGICNDNSENAEREFTSERLGLFFILHKLKKFTEDDKKNNIKYYYKKHFYAKEHQIGLLGSYISPRKSYQKYLNFSTKEQIFYIIIQLDEQDIANTKKLNLEFLYSKENECND